jgi:hypothetical protein
MPIILMFLTLFLAPELIKWALGLTVVVMLPGNMILKACKK